MTYQGSMTDVSQVPMGTPVEYNGKIGILKGDLDKIWAFERPTFLAYQRDERTFKLEPFGEYATAHPTYDYNARRYTIPKVNLQVKVLTGPTAQVLRRHIRDHIRRSSSVRFGGKVCNLGTDPEVFVLNGQGNLFPAYEFLSDKKSTLYNAYWDGFQAEFRTTAGYCNANLCDSVREGLLAVRTAARKKDPRARLTIRNVMEIPEQTLSTAAEEHVAFGCEPSLNVYDMVGMPCPDARMYPLRFAGGHIHFGYQVPDPKTFFPPVVRALDAILGVASVAIADGIDDPRRRQMYGLPGEYRLPKHGLEYRTLSNFWLSHPALTFLTWEIARVAFDLSRQGFADAWRADQDEVIEIISTCNAKAARAVFERNEAFFKAIMARCFESYRTDGVTMSDELRSKAADKALSVIHGGLGSFIAEPDNLDKNWRFGEGGTWKQHAEGTKAQFVQVVMSGEQKV